MSEMEVFHEHRVSLDLESGINGIDRSMLYIEDEWKKQDEQEDVSHLAVFGRCLVEHSRGKLKGRA